MKTVKKNKGKKLKKHKKSKQPVKVKQEISGKTAFMDPQGYRKKAPRRKVKVEIDINFKAFKGKGSEFKLFS